jgi:putative transposase
MTMAASSYRYQSRRSDEPLRNATSGVSAGEATLRVTAANQEWALDFVHDAVECGRAIRVLSVVDAYTRECLALEVDTSFASRRVTRVLDAIVAERGQPQAIRYDNGPELTSRHFLAWCVERQIELVHIQPGKPTQNARVESFHGRLREECLSVSWFQNLFDARRKIAAWRKEYNEERPHSSLGYQTPKEFAAAQAAGQSNTAPSPFGVVRCRWRRSCGAQPCCQICRRTRKARIR